MKRLTLCLWLLLPLAALAGEPVTAESGLQLILKQQNELKADIDAGRTDGLTTRQVNQIRKAQVEVFAVTEGKTGLGQLTVEEQVRLENALERINAEVQNTRAARDNQNVCWRERVSGTKVNVTRCGTEAEMREAREGARDFLERPKVCGVNCG
ncbi:hypothetical protein [Lysobacter niastensis]|uniref:Uncharacterized protein n=1 Tax=Lysobacter niastensis TaxID=380629 RepID=A0ABS0B3K5_9GAMM|nr:hypothetical protein [Lysobacter niastensis]MBF6023059.1 hypothetical protein [Lysobacter niastensis]